MLLLSVFLLASTVKPLDNWAQIQNPEIQYGNGEKKLSDINVLLPLHNCVDCRRVYHTIAAFNGCYQWKNSFENLVQMTSI